MQSGEDRFSATDPEAVASGHPPLTPAVIERSGGARYADVFPADDELAPFVLTMCAAAGEIETAVRDAVDANVNGRDDFYYRTRLAAAHFFEAEQALRKWRESDEKVRKFLNSLPKEAKTDLKMVMGTFQQMGFAAAEQNRNRTFHYPYPDTKYASDVTEELREAMEALADEEVNIHIDGRTQPPQVHFPFASQAALVLAMGKHSVYDKDKLRQEVGLLASGATAFANFAGHLFLAYCDQRGISFGELQFVDEAEADTH